MVTHYFSISFETKIIILTSIEMYFLYPKIQIVWQKKVIFCRINLNLIRAYRPVLKNLYR